MDRAEMIMRYGYYAGISSRYLGDDGYALRFLGRAEQITERDYSEASSEICARLVAAGKIAADEDPWEGRFTR